jgi:hypothetical protein
MTLLVCWLLFPLALTGETGAAAFDRLTRGER